MKITRLILLFTMAILSSSCEENSITIHADNLLLGSWIDPIYDEETTTFKRGNGLPNEAYGVAFSQTKDFTERTSGFCGTPPLTFFNVDGSFELEDTLIKITVHSYPSFYQWRIIKLTDTELVVKRELTEQEKDHRALMDLFNEIAEIAYSKTCSDNTEWAFAAYGAKACGGPQGYIPYSKDIDVSSFLQKVETYSNAEKEYNIKWSIASDCAIVNPPKRVDCQYNYPVLIY